MALLVEVAFKGNRKEFFHWEGDAPLPMRAPVIVEADRGEDLGYVHAQGDLAQKRIEGVPHAPEEGVTRVVRRLATADEVKRVEELREQDDSARRKAMERVKANGLAMKLSDAEWRWDRRKLTIFFTAEKRVDFRTLVRELASLFRTRIELKQIGVRDEARRLGGIGRCGREYCSASWLPDLRPVNLGVARDQRLSLNPTQISGACGRLMCCLRYEHEFYVSQRRRFPKEGTIIETATGEEKVVANDIFRERVTLRNPEGETRVIPLAELRRDWTKGPTTDRAAEEETPALAVEGLSDEVLRLQDTAEMPAWLPRAPGRSGAVANRRSLPVQGQGDPAPGLERDSTGAGSAREARGPGARGRGREPREGSERGPGLGRGSGGERRGTSEGRPRGEGRAGAELPDPGAHADAPPPDTEGRPRDAAPGEGEAGSSNAGEREVDGGTERPRGRRRRGRRGGRRNENGSGGAPGETPPTIPGDDA